MFINHSSREVTAKVVYYGPGLSGKTTNLQYIFSVTNPRTRGELISIETEVERTLFFDLLPINVGLINGYQAKFQLYTVPGQIFYDSTRKLVLKGADGIVFVADSQELMRQANLYSMENLRENLASHKLVLDELPIVFQFNKRDLSNTLSPRQLNRLLNKQDRPYYEAIATEGKGVLETLRGISTIILNQIKHMLEHAADEAEEIPFPTVDFDINEQQEIIKRENLPLKKIHRENLESRSHQMEPAGSEMKFIPLEEKQAEKEKEVEDLKVETVEETEEFRDLNNIFKGHGMQGSETEEDTNEFETFKEIGDLLENEQVEEVEELEDLDAIKLSEEENENLAENKETAIGVPGPPEPPELPELEVEFEDEPQIDIEQLPELEDLEMEPAETAKKEEAEGEPAKKIREIEEIKKSLDTEKTGKKEKTPAEKLGGLDLFERLKDNTRLTVIKKVHAKDSELIIDIKDKNSRVLESIKVTINPETRKVNLILDVEK
jgi:signal recognition particle receptor subunit beta